jgi:aminotransferase in exopolysaccharide biosynthesis
MTNSLIKFIRDTYQSNEFVPLHAPSFNGNEKKYVDDTLESTFVSSVGKYVDRFEQQIEVFTGAKKAVAVVNGTSALHTALYMSGIRHGDLVITQALTFVATCNALYHMGAAPIFVDVSLNTLGLCPKATEAYLDENTRLNADGECIHLHSQQHIKAVMPMHTFGHPVELEELLIVCKKFNLLLIEDAAESLGSFYKDQHTGTFGDYSAISFNGNKIITTGGGGMVLCQSKHSGERAKHITTTAKQPHAFEYFHDEAGFNYRLPNLNAALGCAQMEALPEFLKKKRLLAHHYQTFFKNSEFTFVKEPEHCHSNYWLNAIICPDVASRETLIKETNANGVMTRPIWKLMHRLPMFKNAYRGPLINSELIESRVVNLPSSPITIGKNYA